MSLQFEPDAAPLTPSLAGATLVLPDRVSIA